MTCVVVIGAVFIARISQDVSIMSGSTFTANKAQLENGGMFG